MKIFKKVIIDTPRGQYEISAEAIAIDRAKYYSKVDNFDEDSPEFAEEVAFLLRDKYEIIDWLINNSDWEDWNGLAIQINDEVNTTDKDFWCDSDNFKVE
jgi:hypothetical protein